MTIWCEVNISLFLHFRTKSSTICNYCIRLTCRSRGSGCFIFIFFKNIWLPRIQTPFLSIISERYHGFEIQKGTFVFICGNVIILLIIQHSEQFLRWMKSRNRSCKRVLCNMIFGKLRLALQKFANYFVFFKFL